MGWGFEIESWHGTPAIGCARPIEPSASVGCWSVQSRARSCRAHHLLDLQPKLRIEFGLQTFTTRQRPSRSVWREHRARAQGFHRPRIADVARARGPKKAGVSDWLDFPYSDWKRGLVA